MSDAAPSAAAGPAGPGFPLATRQVHLDFHTSPRIPGVGERFDADRFAGTLADAGVNSVTCFARCHHGMLYHRSRWRPDLMHPHLAVPDLLNRQVDACHARGIRVPAYTTVQWDAWAMDAHPEWRVLTADGSPEGPGPLEAGFYRSLDVLHPGYRAFLREHVADLLEACPEVDGLFFDIVAPRPSRAPWHLHAMDAAGLDPADAADQVAFAERVIDDWKREMTGFVRSLPAWTDNKTIFYNAGHVGPRHRATRDAYSHYELESLPSGGWGYMHFPVSAAYARTLGKPLLGQTAKFHTAWGDFHSYKNPAALRYEGLRMLATGAAIEVGDQLHPDGRLDGPTYQNIGALFREAAAVEAYCLPAEPVKEVAVVTPEASAAGGGRFAQSGRPHEADTGAVRLMAELRRCCDRVDPDADFSAYPIVVVPAAVPVDAALAARLRAHAEAGGRVLLAGDPGPAADLFGVRVLGPAEHEPEFLVPLGGFAPGLPRAPHVMYDRGWSAELVDPAAEVLAESQAPYFNRTWRHYCSHQHAPSCGEAVGPAVVERAVGAGADAGRCVWFAHPVFSTYQRFAPRWVRGAVGAALDRLRPALRCDDGPVGMDTSLMHQPAHRRYVLHALYFPASRKAAGWEQDREGRPDGGFDVIEEAVELRELRFELRPPRAVRSATLRPQDRELPLTLGPDGAVSFTLPRLDGHQVVTLPYA